MVNNTAEVFWSCENIFIRHRWEGEMGSCQHKSPHQVRTFTRGLYVVTSAEMSPYRRSHTNIWRKQMAAILYFVIFSYNIGFLLITIALILIDDHYFYAKASKKINWYRQNAQNYIFFKKQIAVILYLSLTKIVWNLKAHITSRFIYKHICLEKPLPKCGYI